MGAVSGSRSPLKPNSVTSGRRSSVVSHMFDRRALAWLIACTLVEIGAHLNGGCTANLSPVKGDRNHKQHEHDRA